MIKIGEFRTKAGYAHTVRGGSFELGPPYEGKVWLVVHDESDTYKLGCFCPTVYYSEKDDLRVEVFVNESPNLWKYTFEVVFSISQELSL